MESLLTWSDDLSVGIQEIDEQHKELVVLLNRLHDAVAAHHGATVCSEILNELAEYTRVLFIAEESLMRILHYPEFEQHKAEHEALVAQVVALQQKLASGQATITFELLHFLKLWLTKHIAGSDRRYALYFLEKGMSPDWAHHVEQTMQKNGPGSSGNPVATCADRIVVIGFRRRMTHCVDLQNDLFSGAFSVNITPMKTSPPRCCASQKRRPQARPSAYKPY